MAWQKAKAPYVKPDNTLSLFKNDRKSKAQDPDYRGDGKINGRDYWISAWLNVSKKDNQTKYLSVKVNPKEGAPTYKRQEEEETKVKEHVPFHDDDIPF